MSLDCALADHHLADAPAHGVLSIVIPTFNRASELEETLQHFKPELDRHSDKVEIIICDNASTDGTRDLCKRWAADVPWLSYYIHVENQGTARQLFLGPQRARCPYVWMFGDDDWIAPGGLEIVLRRIEQDQPAFLTLNREVRDQHMDVVINASISSAPDHTFDRFEDFLGVFGIQQMGFITTQIVRRDLFNAIDPAPYIVAEGYNHVCAYIEACHGRPVAYVASPVVVHRFLNFADSRATFTRNFKDMTLPLMRALEAVRSRIGLGSEIYEQIAGGKAVSNPAQPMTHSLSEAIIENLYRALGGGHTFTPAEWDELVQMTHSWRPATRTALSVCRQVSAQYEDVCSAYQRKLRQIQHELTHNKRLNPDQKRAKKRDLAEVEAQMNAQLAPLARAAQQHAMTLHTLGAEGYLTRVRAA